MEFRVPELKFDFRDEGTYDRYRRVKKRLDRMMIMSAEKGKINGVFNSEKDRYMIFLRKNETETAGFCTCPDFEERQSKRGLPCQHLIGALLLGGRRFHDG